MAEDIEDTVYRDFINFVHKNLWVASPEYAGWLQKRSSNWLLSSSFFGSRAWASKWVSLHGSELVYMDKEPLLYNTTVKSALDSDDNSNVDHLNIRRGQINGSTMILSDEENNECGFVVQFNIENMPNWHFRASSPEEKMNWVLKLTQVQAIVCWLDEYERVKILGVGGQGIVYELRHRVSGKRCALKEMEIKSDRQMANAVGEAQFLKTIVETVSHPNIMQIQKVFQVGSKFYLVFPLCTGGEVYDALVKRGHFTEFDAARIMQELISALHVLHEHDILHLDIKPENILFETPDFYSKIFLTDFGLSKLFSEVNKDSKIKKNNLFDDPANKDKSYDEIIEDLYQSFLSSPGELETKNIRGTYGYMSPELILCGTYSKALDVFAAGVVLYILLCGYPPFYSKSNRQTFLRTIRGMYKMEGNEWDHISLEAKDLVQRMLERDPRKRITTGEILQHPWITSVNVKVDDNTESLPTTPLSTMNGMSPSVPEVRAEDKQMNTVSEPCEAPSVVPPAAVVEDDENSLFKTAPSSPSAPFIPSTTSSNTYSTASSAKINPNSSSMPPISSLQTNLRQLSMQMRRNSLRGSISNLANHVAVLHTNKIAATVTKLMSMAAEGNTAYHSRLAAIYLKSLLPSDYLQSVLERNNSGKVPSSGSQNLHEKLTSKNAGHHDTMNSHSEGTEENSFSPEQLFVMVSNDTKAALRKAIFANFGTCGRLSFEQFIKVRKYFGFRPLQTVNNGDAVSGATSPVKSSASKPSAANDANNGTNNNSLLNDANNFVNLGDLLMLRMLDRDGDGYITIEDILTAQMLSMQRNEQFLQAIFRVYVEAIWYPGKHLNMLHAMQQMNAATSNEGQPNSSDDKQNVIEPPRFITAKHVSAIFEKFGYSADHGLKVFDILWNALQKLKHGKQLPSNLNDEEEGDNKNEESMKIPATIVEDEDGGDEIDGEELEKSMLKNPNPMGNQTQLLHGSSSFHSSKVDGSAKDGDSFIDRLRKHSQSFAKLRQQTLLLAARQSNTKRMDVNDFIRVARIDDVLVQVLFRHTHESIYSLVKYCERKAQLEMYDALKRGVTNPVVDLENLFLDQLRKCPDVYRPEPLLPLPTQ